MTANEPEPLDEFTRLHAKLSALEIVLGVLIGRPSEENPEIREDVNPAVAATLSDLPVEGRDFGYRTGRHGLLRILSSQRDMGVNHVSLHLRSRTRPVDEMLAELAEYVLPEFPALGD